MYVRIMMCEAFDCSTLQTANMFCQQHYSAGDGNTKSNNYCTAVLLDWNCTKKTKNYTGRQDDSWKGENCTSIAKLYKNQGTFLSTVRTA